MATSTRLHNRFVGDFSGENVIVSMAFQIGIYCGMCGPIASELLVRFKWLSRPSFTRKNIMIGL